MAHLVAASLLLVLLGLGAQGRPKSWREGPTVDPGVFVITHIRSCRNGSGYCILGHACNVDQDFVKDDLGGNCTGLASAFSPPAQFVCCQQNPANFEETENDALEALILAQSLNEANKADKTTTTTSTTTTTRRPPTTRIVTEVVTELETQTETVTKVEAVTQLFTEIVTELVESTTAAWQADSQDLPEDWMAMTEEEAMAIIRNGGGSFNSNVGGFEEAEKLFGGAGTNDPVQLSEEQAQELVGGTVDRMDTVFPGDEDEEDYPDFLESLGSPTAFSSILSSVPEVITGDWQLQEDQPGQPWAVPGEGGRYQGTSRPGEGDVFEFEIGAALPAAGPTAPPQGEVLTQGLVIDDTPALHQGALLSVLDEGEGGAFPGSIEPVSLDYIIRPEVEEEGWYKPVVLGKPSDFSSSDYSTDYTDYTTDFSVTKAVEEAGEPELDCTMSILWGFQCSLSGVDKKRSPSSVPYPVDQPDPVAALQKEPEYKASMLPVQGLVEINPPSGDLGWVTLKEPEEETTTLEAVRAGSSGSGFNPSGVVVSLPEQILQTDQGKEVVEQEQEQENIFNAFSKEDTRGAQPRLEDGEVAVKYHNLDRIIEDADLLKIFMDTLENQTPNFKNSSFSLKEVMLGHKDPYHTTTEDAMAEETMTEETMTEETMTEKAMLEKTAVTEPEPEPETEESDDLPHPEFTTVKAVEERRKRRQCGVKGGRSVLEAYGKKASEYMLDFFIDSWVFGKDAQQKARFEDTQARIIGGKVTSTMLYCWIAAIVTKEGEFICTGTLVADDLVVTSGSCINFLFERGLGDFKVVLGDSHLGLDLQFGVQEHAIMRALVHENYNINDDFHYNDIGLVILRSPARLGESVCTLCLPREGQGPTEGQSCTVTGYGRPTDQMVTLGRGSGYWADSSTDGVLREAELAVRGEEVCTEFRREKTGAATDMAGLLCAGGTGQEKACYVHMDGGSPLSCLLPSGHNYLAGVVSWGSACGQGTAPSLFTHVSDYVGWIRTSYRTIRPEADF